MNVDCTPSYTINASVLRDRFHLEPAYLEYIFLCGVGRDIRFGSYGVVYPQPAGYGLGEHLRAAILAPLIVQ